MDFWQVFLLLLIWIPLMLIWASAIFDVFRRDDLSGGMKAVWLLVIVFLPLLGTLIYLITRPAGATAEERRAVEAASRDFVERYSPTTSAQQLALLADLKDRGTLTEEEFAAEKARILGTGSGTQPADAPG